MKNARAYGLLAAALAASIAFPAMSPAEELAAPPPTSTAAEQVALATNVTIWRDPGCGCCDAYSDYLEANGFRVTRIDDPNFDERSTAAGVPAQGLGCHLAEVGGYYVSGLVPAEIIERLLTEQPEIAGITLPGMPPNAPGMAREKTGTLKIYAFGEGGITIYSNE